MVYHRILIWISLVILSYWNAVLPTRGQIFHSWWNEKTQVPSEVRWLLLSSDLGSVSRDPSWRFKRDLPKDIMKVRHSDYTNTGYDRGHMCPAQDRSSSKEAMRLTFVLSNICPQVHSVNAGSWKVTENEERKIARAHGRCRVIAMPLFLEKDTIRIGAHGLAVPHAFLKIIYDTNPDTLYQLYFIWNK